MTCTFPCLFYVFMRFLGAFRCFRVSIFYCTKNAVHVPCSMFPVPCVLCITCFFLFCHTRNAVHVPCSMFPVASFLRSLCYLSYIYIRRTEKRAVRLWPADAVVGSAVSRLGSTSLVLGPGLQTPSEDLFYLWDGLSRAVQAVDRACRARQDRLTALGWYPVVWPALAARTRS